MSLPTRDGIPLDDFIDAIADEMADVTLRASQEAINVVEWEAEMQRLVKVVASGADMLGRDGTPYGILGRVRAWFRRRQWVREQFGYLRGFANEIRAGTFDPESLLPRVVARARMYANSARRLYSETRHRIMRARGFTEKRRVLGVAEHCPDCEEMARRGWVPIDDPSVTPIGVGTRCMSNCKCDLEYR